MTEPMEVVTQVISLDTVINYFVKGFERKPVFSEWYLDPVKRVVIFRLHVRIPASPTEEKAK